MERQRKSQGVEGACSSAIAKVIVGAFGCAVIPFLRQPLRDIIVIMRHTPEGYRDVGS